MTLRELTNGIRVLYGIDMQELVDAGAIPDGDMGTWIRFRENPPKFLIHASDRVAESVWKVVEARTSRGTPA